MASFPFMNQWELRMFHFSMMVRMRILYPMKTLKRFPSSIQGRIIILMTNEFERSILFLSLIILKGLELDYCHSI
jgi:hypothetical protein